MSINGFELSAAQKRTWREQEQNGKLYSTTVCAEISGALDGPQSLGLRRALVPMIQHAVIEVDTLR